MSYYFHKNVNYSFAQAEERVREALQNKGFGILTEIDMQATFKKKLDKDIRPHKILGACNPHYAFEATQAEEKLSTLLPCNVTLAEQADGSIDISVMDPEAAFSLVGNAAIAPVATEVKDILKAALQQV